MGVQACGGRLGWLFLTRPHWSSKYGQRMSRQEGKHYDWEPGALSHTTVTPRACPWPMRPSPGHVPHLEVSLVRAEDPVQ